MTASTLLALQGPINLSQPDVTLRLIVVIPCQTESLPGGMPHRFYFAREVALSKRSALTPYALPKRLYLGPTSMDHEMAAVICNLAKEWDPCPKFHLCCCWGLCAAEGCPSVYLQSMLPAPRSHPLPYAQVLSCGARHTGL